MSERWTKAFREAPEIFDELSRAEDPDGLVVERLVALAAPGGRDVLELGCGTGRYTEALAPHAGRWVAVEPSAPMLALARARWGDRPGAPELLEASAESLPLDDGSFDLAFAAWVFAYLGEERLRRALSEASRVLRPGPRSGLWLLQNHWTGEFQEIRRPWSDRENAWTRGLIDRFGFEVAAVVEDELRFESLERAEHVVGYLCGEEVGRRVRESGRAVIGHAVAVLHLPAERLAAAAGAS